MAFDLGARAVAADNFKLLGKKEIRATVAGKDITDGAHGSFCLRPDGALVGVESGARWTGAWNVQKSKLCMSNPGSTAFDVTPNGPASWATARASPITPCFEAL